MKTLVVYYSRTGNTKKIADELAAALGADVEELRDRIDRSGKMGYMLAGRDAMRKRRADLEPVSRNPADYDLVVIGGPVWALTMCTPATTYASDHRDALRRVAFFATAGDARFTAKTFPAMEESAGKPPLATFVLSEDDVAGDHSQAVERFAASLKSHDPT